MAGARNARARFRPTVQFGEVLYRSAAEPEIDRKSRSRTGTDSPPVRMGSRRFGDVRCQSNRAPSWNRTGPVENSSNKYPAKESRSEEHTSELQSRGHLV